MNQKIRTGPITWDPVDTYYSAHGRFDSKARSWSLQWRAGKHVVGIIAIVVIILATAAVLSISILLH